MENFTPLQGHFLALLFKINRYFTKGGRGSHFYVVIAQKNLLFYELWLPLHASATSER